jgi:hypothetical protein
MVAEYVASLNLNLAGDRAMAEKLDHKRGLVFVEHSPNFHLVWKGRIADIEREYMEAHADQTIRLVPNPSVNRANCYVLG